MNKKEKKKIEIKILELLDKEEQRPDIFEAMEILRNCEDAFFKKLKEYYE